VSLPSLFPSSLEGNDSDAKDADDAKDDGFSDGIDPVDAVVQVS
jgi:hypothetical protein